MSLANLPAWLNAQAIPARIAKLLEEKPAAEPVVISGLGAPARAFLVAGLAAPGSSGLIVARNPDDAKRWQADLESFGLYACYFPAIEVSPYDMVSPEPELMSQRQAALASLVAGQVNWVVTTQKALTLRLPDRQRWSGGAQRLKLGMELAPQELVGQLVRLGFRPAATVAERGEFSRRGGIIDVFPPHSDDPVRLEWFGDELDSMRLFDAETQRSGEAVQELNLYPTRELLLPEEGWDTIAERIRDAFKRAQKKLDFVANKLKARTEQDLQKFASFGAFEGAEFYSPFFSEQMGTLFDYLPLEATVWWDDREHLLGELAKWTKLQDETYAKQLKAGEILPLPYYLHLNPTEALAGLGGRKQVDLTTKTGGDLALEAPASPRFHGEFDKIAIQINQWQHAGERVVIVTQQPQRAFAILDERGVNAALAAPPDQPEGVVGGVWVVREDLLDGFSWPGLRLVILTDLELFGQHRRASSKSYKKFSYQGTAFTSAEQLKPGDYVVHQKHGIGRFITLAKLSVDNQEREYLQLSYQNDDRLYVPVDQINFLHRYRASGEGTAPKLHKMGGVEWENSKKRVKKGLKELAEDLVKLYASRASMEGYSYPDDTIWQREMEEAFPYVPTIDQLKAIEETKRDMERARPMDRLICGDVGFGKTEVALRAAFKALMAGKQVAVLAPTTVLAQQHYHVFRERYAPYPVRVGLLSRFRSAKEQREVIAKLKSGEMDLVIGTHRLLGKDLGFKDLGLLIIDEEHRFGVANKERLKQVKQLVDVITMSATPIPRTLYMALSGARDMSLITTPPRNRQPVKTTVGPYEPEAVRTAILHELERGGQVFFLHNRVESIGRILIELQQLVPEARVKVAHGQLPEDALEDMMLGFKDHDFDILLSTTIIESGLDIPRANTMIIDDADNLGLAQLYQLRGRVGRSEVKAYCHCFYRKDKQLTDDARDRLQALQQFTALGSGYQIALRDLEIRGVGNLLGPEQHGHMISVGMDFYTQMLEEAVEEARGNPVQAGPDPATVDLNVAAFIPEEWLGEGGDKMAQYRRLAGVTGEKELQILEAEWRDRFGQPPTSVANLLRIVRLKLWATEIGVTAIRSDPKLLRVVGPVPGQAFYKCQAKDKSLVGWAWSVSELTINRERMRPEDQLAALEKLLKALGDCILAPAS
ncbi:MAG: transcription-repair coupling factor [Cyanobacteria bacterium RYN_339]|nr:transcription-repair coupling factor [Cyanobacteria bacterium RYN_339]